MQSVNLAAAVLEMGRLQPEALAMAMPAGKARNNSNLPPYQKRTFGELAKDIECVARGLRAAGFAKGDRVVMMVPPGIDFFVLSFSLLQAGIVPVFIDPGIGLQKLATCITEAEPGGFIGISKAHMARALLGWGRRTIQKLVTIGPRLWWGGNTMKSIRQMGQNSPLSPLFNAQAHDVAAIIFTSGSTGLPKGVVYTHGNFHAQLGMIRKAFEFSPGDIDMPTFPPYALFNAALGVSSIIPDMNPSKPAMADPLRIITPIQEFGITSMFGSPALLDKVGRYGMANGVRLPSLKRVISSGAPVPAKALMRFSSMLSTGARIYTPYGATEAMPVSSITSHELLGDLQKKTEDGKGICIGKPIDGVEVAIIRITDEVIANWSEDLKLPPGSIGEIVVKGENVTASYLGRAQASRLAKIQDGREVRHRMGDLGYFDEEGTLWFCGRKAHRVQAGDTELYSIPCECIFNRHPQVHRTALVEANGKAILCVELERSNRTIHNRQLQRELLAMAASHPSTRKITTILFHPGFPVDIRHNAKIIREELAVWAKKKLE